MLDTVTHIPLTEFEQNPAHVFRRVTNEQITIVVEDETGHQMVLRPAQKSVPAPRRTKKSKIDYEALAAAAGSWKDVDTDTLIKHLYESRTITTRPLVEL